MKRYKPALARPTTQLINLSVIQTVVPPAWKVATVTPVFKSGDKTHPANYRPVSILSLTSKITETGIAESITEHLYTGGTPLHPMQYSLCPHHYTETVVCVFAEKNYLDKNPCVGAVLVVF